MVDLGPSHAALPRSPAGLPGRLRGPIRSLDPVLIVTALLLTVFGLMMVYSSTWRTLTLLGNEPFSTTARQMFAMALGIGLAAAALVFDYRMAKVYAPLVYAGLLVLLVAVVSPLGSDTAGAQRGFEIGIQITPSEYMKVGLILMLAAFLSEVKATELRLEHVVRAAGIAALPVALVFLQPDLGTSIVLGAILVGTLVVAGARARHLGMLALTGLVLLFGALQMNVIKDYQLQRIEVFLNRSDASEAARWNLDQSEITIGSGGLTGVGYLRGPQTNLDFVPEQHSDFIFTAVGEEFGFVGGVVLLSLFGVLLWRGFRIATSAKDRFGTYVAAGIISMWALQIFVNIGMTLGIMPITGIPLPFLSYGGSSLVTNFVAIGLLLNIHMRRFSV
jgi:rod shape determining protein RodA